MNPDNRPIRNPPIWAKKATPEPLEPTKSGNTFWKMNQNGRYHFAEMRINLVKNPISNRVTTFAFGNRIR